MDAVPTADRIEEIREWLRSPSCVDYEPHALELLDLIDAAQAERDAWEKEARKANRKCIELMVETGALKKDLEEARTENRDDRKAMADHCRKVGEREDGLTFNLAAADKEGTE